MVSLFAFRSSIPGVFVIGQMAAGAVDEKYKVTSASCILNIYYDLGDGMADIVGRKFGTSKWPFSSSKSYAGSLGFVFGAFAVTSALLSVYAATGCLFFDFTSQWPLVLLISFFCAAVELIPIGILVRTTMTYVIVFIHLFLIHLHLLKRKSPGDDNITVSIAAFVAAFLLFPK